MPILFACQQILKLPAGSRRIIAMGPFFEVLYIPREALEARAAPDPVVPAVVLKSKHAPTGAYTYICEHEEPDGRFSYPQQGLTIPEPGAPMFQGLKPGQCSCCYYRRREVLEWTTSGTGLLALMTPGWYQDEQGTWRWWHGDCPHGNDHWACCTRENLEAEENLGAENLAEEDLEAEENLQDLEAEENLQAQPAHEQP